MWLYVLVSPVSCYRVLKHVHVAAGSLLGEYARGHAARGARTTRPTGQTQTVAPLSTAALAAPTTVDSRESRHPGRIAA